MHIEPDPDALRLGQRIRQLRRERGLSQGALAEASGLATRHVSGIERGLLDPSVVTLKRVAEGLGLPLAVLFMFPDDEFVKLFVAMVERISKLPEEAQQKAFAEGLRSLIAEWRRPPQS